MHTCHDIICLLYNWHGYLRCILKFIFNIKLIHYCTVIANQRENNSSTYKFDVRVLKLDSNNNNNNNNTWTRFANNFVASTAFATVMQTVYSNGVKNKQLWHRARETEGDSGKAVLIMMAGHIWWNLMEKYLEYWQSL